MALQYTGYFMDSLISRSSAHRSSPLPSTRIVGCVFEARYSLNPRSSCISRMAVRRMRAWYRSQTKCIPLGVLW